MRAWTRVANSRERADEGSVEQGREKRRREGEWEIGVRRPKTMYMMSKCLLCWHLGVFVTEYKFFLCYTLTNMMSVAACTTDASALSTPWSSMGRHTSIAPARRDACTPCAERMQRIPSRRANLRNVGAPSYLKCGQVHLGVIYGPTSECHGRDQKPQVPGDTKFKILVCGINCQDTKIDTCFVIVNYEPHGVLI